MTFADAMTIDAKSLRSFKSFKVKEIPTFPCFVQLRRLRAKDVFVSLGLHSVVVLFIFLFDLCVFPCTSIHESYVGMVHQRPPLGEKPTIKHIMFS